VLKILLGTDWVANRERILGMITEDVAKGKGGRILMVPELISHDMERRLCAAAGDTASRYAEVLSFSRLVRRVSEEQRLAPEKCLDNGGRLVAMAAASRQLSSKLKSYASVETRPEFLTGLVDAVDEFKRCCITAADLKAAAQRSGGTLAQKLEELSLLLDCYDSLCAQGKRDPRDQMNWVLEQMECCDFAENHCFYIDGFPDFTRQHMAILEHLIRFSGCVTVSLNCDQVNSDHSAFETAGKTAAELVRLAKQAEVAYEIEIIKPELNEKLDYVNQHLFQGRLDQREDLRDVLSVWRAESQYEECLIAAEKIQELVRNGCRYRDISLVCADLGSYRGVLELAFHRCGIPLYLSGTEDILQKTAISTVLLALEAASEGFEQGTVLRYLKSALSPLDAETCDHLENYAVLWGIRGTKWTQDWTLHPKGLSQEWSREDEEYLAMLNRARGLGIRPLITLRDQLRAARNLAQQVDAVCGFLEDIDLAGRLEELAAQADGRGDNASAQELLQLWEILLGALEQLHDVLGDTVWDGEAFQSLLRLLLSQYDVGTIPPVLDAVTAGPVSAMRCQQVKHLFVLGAQEGSLPSYAGSAGVLTDQERVELRRLGVPLTGGAMEGVAAEFSEIYGVFCGARERIFVSCPPGQSAFVYRRLCDMLGVREDASIMPGPGGAASDPWEAGAYLARWDLAEAAASLGAQEGFRDAKEKAAYALGLIEKSHIQALYGNRLTLSASQIDQQAECRLGYFLRYGLKAKERKELTVDPAEFGTYVHAVLEETAREIKSLGGWHQVGLEQTLEIAHRHSDSYAQERFAQLESERLQYLFRRNGLELDAVVEELWKELSQSAFEPLAFELDFGKGAAMPEVHTPGKHMDASLRGFVDRVDQWKDELRSYFRVVDYKTGKKDFDYCDVFNGVGLQMLLYLFALERGGRAVLDGTGTGAGVQYFPARFPMVNADGRLMPEEADSEREKQLRRKGLVLMDEDVLQAMEPGEEFRTLNCKRKADGSITGDVATREQMALLETYVFKVVGDLVDQIASGDVSPNPYTRGSAHNACAFCPYDPVCRLSREQGRRNYKTMTAQRFWEEIEKEVERRG